MAVQNNRLTAEEYEQRFSDIHPPFETRDAALVDANRCLFCYDAPCTKSCPTGINVPKFIKQITTDNLKGAAYTIFSSNIMGGGCAKVCPVEKLCEGACVYNLMEETAIPIARLQRYATEPAIKGQWRMFERKQRTGKKVAIIGAGPAGLSCAHALSREGVDVTIYEKEAKGGGLMTYGIAAYKVTPAFCEEEVSFITGIGGIDIRYNQELGKDILLSALQEEYDAVYLAFGVGLARQLYIPGEQLEGVVDAISFIYDIRNSGFPAVPVGDQVAVIGMGMTAIDAATQARRLGAKEVTLVYRRTQQEMPCTVAEMDIALLDGCKIIWLAAPAEIIGENGKATQLICHSVRLEEDNTGRRQPVLTDEKIVLPVDMVIKAAGQMPFEQLIYENQLHHNGGKIAVTGNGVTSINGVFAGGDCVNGGKEVVDAVQAGKEGAAAILAYLQADCHVSSSH
ncbi:NAD(P)-dependent oxidoreductase [Chitinophaga rhizophila]|uniref:NAD(P)-dependent oxidoreductase n=1 Tax=Chitinophaga rhizophila TaxID=2866212 RepID=A0ABS7GMJ5_9BACT|nr:NAD(P)-dependent oxidoreductase [Chitinophaga rhizophila]MBW8687883.1 NAD(P)-dependent oxidoreductase [Chitinophaga rhizophila]